MTQVSHSGGLDVVRLVAHNDLVVEGLELGGQLAHEIVAYDVDAGPPCHQLCTNNMDG